MTYQIEIQLLKLKQQCILTAGEGHRPVLSRELAAISSCYELRNQM